MVDHTQQTRDLMQKLMDRFTIRVPLSDAEVEQVTRKVLLHKKPASVGEVRKLLDANAGVEPQTETVWRQADRYRVPRIVFVNKMDKIGADFFNCVKMIKDRTGATPAPIALPIGAEDKLEGIIDLITMEEWVYQGEDLGASWKRQPIRDSLKAQAEEWRGKLIELALDFLHLANIIYNKNVIDHFAISIPHRAGVQPDRAYARIVAPQL